MARVFVSRRCPHCNTAYERYSQLGTYLPKQYGCPFATCQSCGKGFILGGVTELALKPIEYYRRRDTICKVAGLLFILIAFGLPVVAGLMNGKQRFEFSWGWFAVWLGGSFICHIVAKMTNDDLRRKTLHKEYEESVRRMRDPTYAAAIRALEERRKDVR